MIRNRIIYNSASNWLFDLEKASGVYIWNSTGEKLLDFTSGWNVANLGWNNEEISHAMVEQIKKNVFVPMEAAVPVQYELAKLITDSLPKELVAVGRATGGMEANEEAVKVARVFTKRKKIIGFHHSYHGQSIETMFISHDRKETSLITSPLKDFIKMEYPSVYLFPNSEEMLLHKFESQLTGILNKEDVAAVITEAGIITGWGSTYIAPKGYLSLLRKLTKKYGTLLLLDEVGTGFSRCGKLFGMNLENVVPDIATFAKGFSNGAVPIGAMVTTQVIADKTWENTNLQSSNGWLPVSCAAAKKTLEIHLRDKVWEKADKDGEYMRNILKDEILNIDTVGDIRGFGMEIGVCFVKDKKTKKQNLDLAINIVQTAKAKGLYIPLGDDANIQLMPPLTIERKDLDKGLEIFIKIVKSFR